MVSLFLNYSVFFLFFDYLLFTWGLHLNCFENSIWNLLNLIAILCFKFVRQNVRFVIKIATRELKQNTKIWLMDTNIIKTNHKNIINPRPSHLLWVLVFDQFCYFQENHKSWYWSNLQPGSKSKKYNKIISHKNYNPRVVLKNT